MCDAIPPPVLDWTVLELVKREVVQNNRKFVQQLMCVSIEALHVATLLAVLTAIRPS